MTKYDLDRAAGLAIEAIHLQISPINTLMQLMDLSEDRATYLLSRVRQQGLLGANGHEPVRVYISRRSKDEKSWLACASCTCHWPCKDAFPFDDPELVKERSNPDDGPREATKRRHERYRLAAGGA